MYKCYTSTIHATDRSDKPDKQGRLNPNTRRNLDLSLLPLITRNPISSPGSLSPTPISPRSLLTNHNIRDAELEPRVLGSDLIRALLLPTHSGFLTGLGRGFFLLEAFRETVPVLAGLERLREKVTFVRDQVRVRNTRVSRLEDLVLVVALADCFDRGGVLGCGGDGVGGVFGDGVGVRGAQAGRAGEDAAGVDAGELAGFRDGVEDLGVCEAVDWEVVDGLVASLEVGAVGGCGEHFVDGAGVGEGEWFALICS